MQAILIPKGLQSVIVSRREYDLILKPALSSIYYTSIKVSFKRALQSQLFDGEINLIISTINNQFEKRRTSIFVIVYLSDLAVKSCYFT